MKLGKKFLSAAAAAMILAGTVCPAGAASIPQAYWPIQAEYIAATGAGDKNGIISSVEKLTVLYAAPTEEFEHLQLAFPCLEAAKAYESLGNFPKASEYYERALVSLRWLCEKGHDYYDAVKATEALLRHTSVEPEVYTLSKTPAVQFNALHEPSNGTYFGRSGSIDTGEQCSAFVLYTHFYTENIYDFDWMLPKNTDNYLLELAWNMPNESLLDLQNAVKPEYKNYIVENLKYLGSLEVPVIIRFASEVNCWTALPTAKGSEAQIKVFADAYINAFRYVETLADEYAPNVAMAYAVNDVSNWYVDIMDFYPGDEYVDWISINTYISKASADPGAVGNGNDAFYSRGQYDNQLTKIQEIVELFGDRKPLFIGECGYSFEAKDGLQTPEYAAEKLTEFYTYVNMVYPQIKAIFHFDTANDKANYTLADNEVVSKAYENAVRSNAPMQTMLTKQENAAAETKTTTTAGAGKTAANTTAKPTANTTAKPAEKKAENGVRTESALNYRKLGTFSEAADSLSLFAYASYPTDAPVTVAYKLNGALLSSSASAPYGCTITKEQLTAQTNVLEVTVKCAATEVVKKYNITVSADGVITCVDPNAPVVIPETAPAETTAPAA